MNKRIKELADQAELTVQTDVGTYMSHPEFNGKFAELIINECADLFPLTFTDEQYQRRIDKTIRKHFGIEQ